MFTRYVYDAHSTVTTNTHTLSQTIQPVVQKETIQPSVVHTTVPIHEVHQNEAKHHAASALPAVSMADFKKQGGSLTGREERYDGFEGEPKAVGGALGGHGHHSGHHSGTGIDSTTGTGIGSTTGTTGTGIGSTTGTHGHHTGTGVGSTGTGTGYDETLGNTTGTKPSMMDKLNPRTDADGDGKRGIGN